MTGRHVVVRTIQRATAASDRRARRDRHGTVHEAIGRRGYVGPHLRPIQHDVRVAGSAVTVLSHPGDNLMIHAAVEVCQAGDILVVTNTAPSTHGMFGDLLAGSLLARGVRGLVIDAGVRDTADLRAMGFAGVVAVRVVPGHGQGVAGFGQRAGRARRSDRQPGRRRLRRRRRRRDRRPRRGRVGARPSRTPGSPRRPQSRSRLNAGELGLDFYGLRDKLAELGVEYVDTLD